MTKLVVFNGIMLTTNKVQGILQQGYLIRCQPIDKGGCGGSNFLVSVKHLPYDVVENKFRDRKWEVSSNAKHLCPNCIDRRRLPRAAKVGLAGSAEKSIIANRQIIYANAPNVRKLVASCGLIPSDVIELESKGHSKFKFIFKGAPEISIGQVNSAESHLVDGLGCLIISSRLKFDVEKVEEQGRLVFEKFAYWYVTLEVVKKAVPLLDASRVAAE